MRVCSHFDRGHDVFTNVCKIDDYPSSLTDVFNNLALLYVPREELSGYEWDINDDHGLRDMK